MNKYTIVNTILIVAYKSNIFSAKEVVDHIDKMIQMNEDFPYEYIDISLIGDKSLHVLESKLSELEHFENSHSITDALLGLIAYKYNNDLFDFERALKCSTRLIITTDLYEEEKYYNLYILDDCYDLAKSGIFGNIQEAKVRFEEEIVSFGNYYEEYLKMIGN